MYQALSIFSIILFFILALKASKSEINLNDIKVYKNNYYIKGIDLSSSNNNSKEEEKSLI